MGKASRSKGARGELELVNILKELTGIQDIKRRCRQHEGDSDIVGLDCFSIEVKRYKDATRSEINGWWKQAVAQSKVDNKKKMPVLFYRLNNDEWRVVGKIFDGDDYDETMETSLNGFIRLARLKFPWVFNKNDT